MAEGQRKRKRKMKRTRMRMRAEDERRGHEAGQARVMELEGHTQSQSE